MNSERLAGKRDQMKRTKRGLRILSRHLGYRGSSLATHRFSLSSPPHALDNLFQFAWSAVSRIRINKICDVPVLPARSRISVDAQGLSKGDRPFTDRKVRCAFVRDNGPGNLSVLKVHDGSEVT